jgi:hypothetical protein
LVLLSPLHGAKGAAVTLLRAFALHLYSKRFPAAYIAEMQFSDNRIRAFCIEPYSRSTEEIVSEHILPEILPALLIHPSLGYAANSTSLSSSNNPNTLFRCLWTEDNVFPDLLRVLVLTQACQERLSLRDRSWFLPNEVKIQKLQESVDKFVQKLQLALAHAIAVSNTDRPSVDLFDWRLFSLVLHISLKSGSSRFPAPILERARTLWAQFDAPQTAFEPIFQSHETQKYIGTEFWNFKSPSLAELTPSLRAPLPIRNPFTDAVLENSVLPEIPTKRDYEEQLCAVGSETIFKDLHHWHSGRLIEALENSLADDGAATYGSSEQNMQKYMDFVEKYSSSFKSEAEPWRPIRNADRTRATKYAAEIQLELKSGTKQNANAKGDRESVKRLDGSGDPAQRRKALEIAYKTHSGRVARDICIIKIILEQWKGTQSGSEDED